MASFRKFERPALAKSGVVTDRDLDIIEAILRYRFSPTSELCRLVSGNEDVTVKRLRKLWEWGYINRFAFPGIRHHSEFVYYLDTTRALDLLLEHSRLTEIHPDMYEEIRLNRQADYAGAVRRGQHMKLGFAQHSLMVSRLHFMLEMASRRLPSQLELVSWQQGSCLRGHKVEVRQIHSRRLAGSNDYVWEEHDSKLERLPVEPDALFSLSFADGRLAHFCYEADRGTMPAADLLKKLRAYHHFIKRQQQHRQAFGVHPIRAVLVETTDERRARKLMRLAQHPAVIGQGQRTALFWFAISPLFTKAAAGQPQYLRFPEIIYERLWALPDFSLHGLADAENVARDAA